MQWEMNAAVLSGKVLHSLQHKREKRELPYYPDYKAMALFPIQGHPWPYNEYKAMAL